MTLFKSKDEKSKKPMTLEDQMKAAATKHGVTLSELKKLAEGKECPKYGTKEMLHIRRVRGNKLTVFNISEKYRGEKISIGRKSLKKKGPSNS